MGSNVEKNVVSCVTLKTVQVTDQMFILRQEGIETTIKRIADKDLLYRRIVASTDLRKPEEQKNGGDFIDFPSSRRNMQKTRDS